MRSLLMLAGLALGACTSALGGSGEAGPVVQRSFEAGDFASVRAEGAHDVIVTVGGAPSVRAEGQAEELDRLDIRVEDGVLIIKTRREARDWVRNRGVVTVHVSAPRLEGAAIAGSGDMRIDRVQAPRFSASISGSGDMAIAAHEAGQASFAIAGSGDIETGSGSAETTDISIAGSGSVALGALQSRRASVSVAGSGDISLQASESVDGSLMGSGDLRVTGAARCSVTKMGSGEISCG